MTTQKEIRYGVIHVHSEHSRKDSVAKIKDLFKRAKDLGATAITLTDHGVLTGIEEAKDAAKSVGINFIPGVEAYFEDKDASVKQRIHLILLAKDETGYQAISLAVTESFANLDNQKMPMMNKETLLKYFGEGSIGHGHVIATSACMNGIICSALRMNDSIFKEIEKAKNKQDKLHKPNNAYAFNKEKVAEIDAKLNEITLEIDSLTAIAKKSFVKKEKALKAFEGKSEYDALKEALEAEKAESKAATEKVAELKAQRTSLKIEQKTAKSFCKPFDDDKEKVEELDKHISELNSDILSDEKLYETAEERTKEFVRIFGEGNFYCEVQYHGIDVEKKVMPIVADIAKKLNLPLVAANDAHMVTGGEDSVKARQIVRSLRFNKWEDVFTGDEELYIKTDEELSSKLMEILPEEVVHQAMEGIGDIVSKCNVQFTTSHHYPKFISENGEDAVHRLRRLSIEGIEWRYPNRKGWTDEHEKRMEYELGIITKLGFCDYLCIVEDFLRYGRLLGKIDLKDPRYLADPYNMDNLKEIAKDNVGLGIGPGRGSAVGSLVCYLTGITGIDPMKYNLIFERFLNEERVSMPDIDSDFKSDIRDKVLDYVKYKYGSDAVCCIMTKGSQNAKGAVRNCARLLGTRRPNSDRNYLALGDQIAKAIGTELGVTLSDVEEKITEQFGNDADAMEIFHDAKLVEGSFINVGMHAAGVIIADNGDVKQYVPLMYNDEKNQWMTQCEKDPCESLGLLKMDFLGLRNLSVISAALQEIKNSTGKRIDIERVPFEKEVFAKIFATGSTNSVFQFESAGMKKMLRQFQPETIEDIILLVAAYRPGPMQFLDSIIAVKHGKKKPEYVIPEMESVLGKTYGYPVYQEQIMQIFNKFAGFSLGESDIIRRYMAKKKTDKFMAYKDKFIDGLCESGANRKKAEEFWTQMVDFSMYAFNKSHAAAYAFVAYYTAWLKYHYPKEYLCAVMNDTLMEKINGLISDGKNAGLKFYPANINESEKDFSPSKDGILFGLGIVKGVSSSADVIINERNRGGKFKSFADFMLRTNTPKDVAENLIYAGAFDSFTKNRQSLVDVVPEYTDILKKIKAKDAIIEKETIKEKQLTNSAERNKATLRKERAIEAKEVLVTTIHDISANIFKEENLMTRLENEKEKTGAFISAHPLDSYGVPSQFNCTPIGDLYAGEKTSIMGIITGFRIMNRKKDGEKFAVFTLEDQTGSVPITCWTSTFKNFNHMLAEDSVVILTGQANEETDMMSDEKVLKFNVQSVRNIEVRKKQIVINIASPMEWENTVKNQIRQYRDKSGSELVCYDNMDNVFRKTGIFVSDDILSVSSLNPQVVNS